MRLRRAALAACLAIGAPFALCGSASASATALSPFTNPRIATADNGETAVVWQSAAGIRAAIGTPGAGYSAPVTISASSSMPTVVMDAAGDVVIIWEATASSADGCYKGTGCLISSLGVFASIRAAGGSFGAPVRLSPPQRFQVADPRVAMNRAGDWVVTLTLDTKRVVGAGSGATPPAGFAALGPAFQGRGDVGIDEAGTATFGMRDAANHPALITRTRDGSLGALTVLDDALIDDFSLRIAVGAQGHTVAVWPDGGQLRSASRPPGGSFGPAVASGIVGTRTPDWIGVDGQGRTVMALEPATNLVQSAPLQVRRGSIGAPFGEPQILTAAGRDNLGPTRGAIDGAGNAVIVWSETERGRNAVAQATFSTDGAPFSKQIVVARETSPVNMPDVAIDGAGRTVLTWTDRSGDFQRILAAVLSPTAVAGPTVVAQGRLIIPAAPPVLPGRAGATAGQVLRIRRDGTVRPTLRCVSPGPSCRGSVRIDVRPAPGRKRVRAGTRAFTLGAGSSRAIKVRVSRAIRRAAARRSLKGIITVRTTMPTGGSVRDVATVTVRRRSS